MPKNSIIRPIRSVVTVVRDLESATQLLTEGIGFEVVSEAVTSTASVGEIWGVADGDFRVRRLERAGSGLGAIDLVESKAATRPIRDRGRAFDLGIFSLNFRTADLDAAVELLTALGAAKVSEPVAYDVGKPMREVLMETAEGTRITLIQIGDADPSRPLFEEPVATYGVIVPSMDQSQVFYRDALGLEVAIAFSHSGPPFDEALGIDGDLSMSFATLTARGEWMAKLELLQLDVTGETAENRSELGDFAHAGYTFLTLVCEDIEAARAACVGAGGAVIVEPKAFDRPFHEGARTMIVRAPGGEYLEIIEA